MKPQEFSNTPPEIPADVEARYKEIQAEMQRLQLSPEATQGESRQARFERQQRLRSLRREFDHSARVPLAKRQLKSGTTVLIMACVALLVCAMSVGGGMLLANSLGRAPDIAGTAANFLDDVKTQDYTSAYALLLQASDASGFTQQATDADTAMGQVISYSKKSQVQGASGDSAGSAAYVIIRAGGPGVTGGKPFPKNYSTTVVIDFIYANGAWGITTYDPLFTIPKT